MPDVTMKALTEARDIAVALAAFDAVYQPVADRMVEEMARAEAASSLRFKMARRGT